MATTTGMILSVNVGTVREFEYSGRPAKSAIWKSPVAGRIAARGVNLHGDEQADRRAHGGPDKAVYAYAAEHYDWWERALGRELEPANFGENLTICGLEESAVSIGDVFRMGDAELEAIAPRLPCYKLGIRFGDLLDDAPTGAVIRREDVKPFSAIGSHEDLLLSPSDEGRFHLMESRIPPGAGAGEELYTFPADIELVYVLAGTLELRVEGKLYRIRSGDTVTYSPREPHTWQNPSDEEEAVVLWFSVPNPHSAGREGEPL